ncbi:terminase family protein [Streptomyces olivoreticuli]
MTTRGCSGPAPPPFRQATRLGSPIVRRPNLHLHGSVRSGKTIASLLAFLISIWQAPATGLILLCGRSLQTIERNILEPLQDPELFGPDVTAEVRHTRGATTANVLGRTVHLIGASDARAEGRLRGATACLAYVDEATLVPEGFWTQLLARLSVPGTRLLATTNPDGPRHWPRRRISTARPNSTSPPFTSASPTTPRCRPPTSPHWPPSIPACSDAA